MENMWFTDNAFLDFKNKTIIFVDQDNRRCEKPFPARQQWRVCNLIYYLAANKTKTRFTIKELTEAIWGGRGKELKRYKIDDVRHATGALRDLLYDEDDTRRKSFLVSDQDYVYFDPPLDKPPPDDSEPEVSESEQKEETMPEQEPEQPVEVSTKPQEEELEQPDELPPDAHEPEELEQPDELPPDDLKSEVRKELITDLLIDIVLICIVGIVLYSSFSSLLSLLRKDDESSMISSNESDVMFDEKNQPYGACGDNLQWKIYRDGTMEISGDGMMYDFGWDTSKQVFNQPWHAFANEILAVTIENGVTYIGANAFDHCSELKRINIPNSVRSMRCEYGIFDCCTSLEEITVDTDSDYFTSLDGVLFDKEMQMLIKYPAKKPGSQYDIPDTVHIIATDCFESSNLVIITIPKYVDTIQKCAFASMKSLDIVDLPYGLRIIEEGLFLDSSIECVGIPETVGYIKDSAFLGCTFLSQISYSGSPDQWDQIEIFDNNDAIYNAMVLCGSL